MVVWNDNWKRWWLFGIVVGGPFGTMVVGWTWTLVVVWNCQPPTLVVVWNSKQPPTLEFVVGYEWTPIVWNCRCDNSKQPPTSIWNHQRPFQTTTNDNSKEPTLTIPNNHQRQFQTTLVVVWNNHQRQFQTTTNVDSKQPPTTIWNNVGGCLELTIGCLEQRWWSIPIVNHQWTLVVPRTTNVQFWNVGGCLETTTNDNSNCRLWSIGIVVGGCLEPRWWFFGISMVVWNGRSKQPVNVQFQTTVGGQFQTPTLTPGTTVCPFQTLSLDNSKKPSTSIGWNQR